MSHRVHYLHHPRPVLGKSFRGTFLLFIFFCYVHSTVVVLFYRLHEIQNFIVFFFPEVMQARGQMSKVERVPHQQPLLFFSKVCLRSNADLNASEIYHLIKNRIYSPLISLFQSHFFFSSLFSLSHLRHIISFVRWLPRATPLSKTLCRCVIYLAILENPCECVDCHRDIDYSYPRGSASKAAANERFIFH